MQRTVLGVVLATIAMYLFGFAYWGASGIPYQAWKSAPDDRAAGAALLEHFPESGVYFLPSNDYPREVHEELFAQGPTGFVILDRDGRPAFDTSIMAKGFFLNGVVAALLAALLQLTLASAPRYGQRLLIAACAGAAAVALIDLGDLVWWAIPSEWVLAKASYNFLVVVLAGAILAHFVRPAEV